MKIGPKYKIARRLGANIFEKTQTQKFALSQARKSRGDDKPRAKTDFGLQMIEKQKARFTYGVNERQFSKYVKDALLKKKVSPADELYRHLEYRLDNVVYRIGIATTRRFARQLVSHGHIMVNNVRVTIPSYQVKKGDVIRIRDASSKKPVFAELGKRLKELSAPLWLSMDQEAKVATVKGEPKSLEAAALFNIESVLDFYRR